MTSFHFAESVNKGLLLPEVFWGISVMSANLADLVKREPGMTGWSVEDHVHKLMPGKIYSSTVESRVQRNDDRVTPRRIATS